MTTIVMYIHKLKQDRRRDMVGHRAAQKDASSDQEVKRSGRVPGLHPAGGSCYSSSSSTF